MQLHALFSALIAAALFGVATPASKALLAGAGPFTLAGLFYLGAALLLLPGSMRRQRREPLGRLRRADRLHLLGSLFFGGMAGPVLLLMGLKLTPASSAALLLNLETPFTALIAWWLFHEHLGGRVWLANGGIVLAGVILVFEGSTLPGAGGLLIALACAAWALDNNHTACMHDIDPVRCTFLKGITFGSVNLLLGLAMEGALPTPAVIAGALLVGAFSYGASIVLYIHAARSMGAARSQMFFSSAPFWGVLTAWLLLGERLRPHQWLSLGLLAAMLVVLCREQHRHEHAHEPLEHDHLHTHDDGHHVHDGPGHDTGPHSHRHVHPTCIHSHPHWPDIHHRHEH